MTKTRFSLYYLASYLVMASLALIIAPQFAMKMLFSNGNYDNVMPHLVGVLLGALAIIVIQIIRLRVEAMYKVTLQVRVFIISGITGLYFYTYDPFFISLFVIVGLGIVYTGYSYYSEKSASKQKS